MAAFAHGAGWPVLMVVFGEMTDDLIGFDPPGVNATTEFPIGYTLPPGVTLPPIPDYLKEFDKQMREYAIIYSYVGAAVLVVSYMQVSLGSKCSPPFTSTSFISCRHNLSFPHHLSNIN